MPQILSFKAIIWSLTCCFCICRSSGNVLRGTLEAEEKYKLIDQDAIEPHATISEIESNEISEEQNNTKLVAGRGIIDILENFRLWQLERRKDVSTTTSAPTPEPVGLEAFLPRLPNVNLDANTFGLVLNNLLGAAQDLGQSFVGPPPTEAEPVFENNSTNISTTIPPNEFFCFLC